MIKSIQDTSESTVSEHELLSQDVQEIINFRPHWIVRKGATIFFIILLFAITFTWFIKYPDVVKGSIRLMTVNMPKQINAPMDGKLEKLLVKNEEDVIKGQPLAFLQSTANHEQVLRLQAWVGEMIQYPDSERIGMAVRNPQPHYFQLGELQPTYQQFQNVLVESEQILSSGYYDRKRESLEHDLVYITSLQNNLQEQRQLLQKDYELEKIEFKEKESLFKDKVITPLEFSLDRSRLIAKEQALQQISAQLVMGELSRHNKLREIADVKKSIFDQQQVFQSSLFEFKSRIEEWIQRYILLAPENGKVLFASNLQENQLLSSSQQVFYIQPKQTPYFGELMVGQRGLGKIGKGQKVMIKVESFPSSEFGYVAGSVEYISSIPNTRDSFLVKVSLPRGLQTSYDKTIIFRNGLTGQGEIITNERRLLERLTGEVRKVFEK